MPSCCCRCWRSAPTRRGRRCCAARGPRAASRPRAPAGARPACSRSCSTASGLALLVARLAGAAPGFARLWALATGAVWLSCGAQAALAAGVGAGSALGGGWLGLLALGVLAGAVLALALRVAPAARSLVRSLRTGAPRLQLLAAIASRPLQRSPLGASAARLRLMRGRAPPVAA